MIIPPFWKIAEIRRRHVKRMAIRASEGVDLVRRGLLGAGLAASLAGPAEATMLWLKGRPAVSPYIATVSNAADLKNVRNLMRSSPATYAGQIIAVLDGDYSAGESGGGERFDFTGITAASTILFYGIGDNTATWPGVNFSSSTNIIFQRVHMYRAAWDSLNGVNIGTGFTNCGFNNCECNSFPLNTIDYRFKVSVSGGTGGFSEGEVLHTAATLNGASLGVGGQYTADGSSASVYVIINSTSTNPNYNGSTGQIQKWNGRILQNADGSKWVQLGGTAGANTPSCNASDPAINPSSPSGILFGFYGEGTGLFINNCFWHDLSHAFSGLTGLNNGANIQYNHWKDMYGSYHAFGGAFHDIVVQWNVGEHLWSTDRDGCPGTCGAHSSICGWGVSNLGTSNNVLFGMNVYVPGYHRYQHPVNMGGGFFSQPSGPEMNDQGTTNAVGGTGGVLTDVLTVSSISTTSPPFIAVGMSVRWPGSPYDGTLTITAQLSGSAGLSGTYRLSRAVTISSNTPLDITTINNNWDIRGNLIIAGSTIAWELAYCQNSKFLWNTIVSGLDLPVSCNVTRHNEYLGNICSKNVANAFINNGGSIIAPDFYTNSRDNFCALWGTQSGGSANSSGQGPASYAGMYSGKTGVGTTADFQLLDAAGALAAFTPKAGSRIANAHAGHSAYVDFANRTTSFPADPVPVSSNVANGISTNTVNVDGSTYSEWLTSVGGDPLLQFTGGANANPALFTAAVQFNIASDGSDDARLCHLITAKNTVIHVQRNTDGTITFTLRSTATIACVSAQTSFTVMGADGLTTVMFTVNTDTYEIYATKGNFVDPFLTITTFTGLAMNLVNGGNNCFIGSNYSGQSPANNFRGVFGAIAIHQAYVDTTTPSALGKLIAQDNLPVNWGSQFATLFGSPAKVAVNDNPATWNSPGVGGTVMATKFIKQTGTYT